jgi:hypothetical protein
VAAGAQDMTRSGSRQLLDELNHNRIKGIMRL